MFSSGFLSWWTILRIARDLAVTFMIFLSGDEPIDPYLPAARYFASVMWVDLI